jgi:hypothetical protein
MFLSSIGIASLADMIYNIIGEAYHTKCLTYNKCTIHNINADGEVGSLAVFPTYAAVMPYYIRYITGIVSYFQRGKDIGINMRYILFVVLIGANCFLCTIIYNIWEYII